jgi:hypothetical protein
VVLKLGDAAGTIRCLQPVEIARRAEVSAGVDCGDATVHKLFLRWTFQKALRFARPEPGAVTLSAWLTIWELALRRYRRVFQQPVPRMGR